MTAHETCGYAMTPTMPQGLELAPERYVANVG
jgi:hypothetical protein